MIRSILASRHDGHKQKSQGYYKANNDLIKTGFWILIGIFLGLCVMTRNARRLWRPAAVRALTKEEEQVDSDRGVRLGVNIWYERIQRVFRRFTYIRLIQSNSWSKYWQPPPLGHAVFLCVYWALILAGLWTDVIFESESELLGIQWEVVGFRAAWVSTMQLPLLYATGCRFNIVSLLTGVTHERLNWFHRWVARTVFLTLIVHWSFFYREWDLAGFVNQEFKMMPMVIWGFAAWAAIGLMVLTGFGLFRDQHFELWLLSHITLAWSVLALSYTHTHCTTYFVGASVAMLIIDLAGRAVLMVIHNFPRSNTWLAVGRVAKTELLDAEYVRLTINKVNRRWKAGQHIYLNIPKIRLFESHPFTIVGSQEDDKDSLSLIIKSHSGMTKSLHERCSAAAKANLRVFIQGPYGNPPVMDRRDAVVFISTGNRASFTVMLLIDTARRLPEGSTIRFHCIMRDPHMICWYSRELQWAIATCKARDISLSLHLHITRQQSSQDVMQVQDGTIFVIGRDSSESDSSSNMLFGASDTASQQSFRHLHVHDSCELNSQKETHADTEGLRKDAIVMTGDSSSDGLRSLLGYAREHLCEAYVSYCRPSADEMIRPTVTDMQGKNIAIVAAVPPILAARIAKSVSCFIKDADVNIELFLEENGS